MGGSEVLEFKMPTSWVQPPYEFIMYPLLGVKVIDVDLAKITYEAIILENLSSVIDYSGICILDKSCTENNTILVTEFKRVSDTCITFTLSNLYNTDVCDFKLAAFIISKN